MFEVVFNGGLDIEPVWQESQCGSDCLSRFRQRLAAVGELKGEIYLGSETFIEEHAHHSKKHTEIPRAQL